MEFSSSYDVFQYLQEKDELNMLQNLDEVLAVDHPLYSETKKLIIAHHRNQEETLFLQTINNSAKSLTNDDITRSLKGEQVDVYRVEELIGLGGMGAVYSARRNDGKLQQKVAIKFIYPSVTSLVGEEVIHSEAQHLINISHPYVARFLSIGTCANNSLQYIVMEYVEGEPIDEYCSNHRLSEKQTLKLVLKLLSAINEVHSNMVVHADIKPSNILVDTKGEPKLMDFGIARRVEQQKSNNKVAPRGASRDYASPEQLQKNNLTAASDIYSIGKLLHKLDLSRGLNLIAKKACADCPEARYASVGQLQEDIERYIENRPTRAESLGFIGRTLRAAQRNYALVIVTSVILVSVTGTSLWLKNKNEELKTTIEREQATGRFMQSIFKYANAKRTEKVGGYTVEEVLADLAERAITELEDYPLARFAILFELAKSYQESGKYEKALKVLDSVPDKKEVLSEPYIEMHYHVSRAYNHNGLKQRQASLSELDKAWRIGEKIESPSLDEQKALAVTLIAKAFFNYYQEDYNASKDAARQVIERYSDILPEQQVATIYNTLAASQRNLGDYSAAQAAFQKSIDILVEKFGSIEHPSLFYKRYNLYVTYRQLDREQEALEGLKVLRQQVLEVYDDDFPLLKDITDQLDSSSEPKV
ncbi:Non-specific serine/threonine protein kinase [Saliniradius amylolyticus]|uniref:Non-specific serine/threonine protein kinase n=1 Tax=Saliniradius amylolyticus TaxID=2183582 RepID=A0A2S2E781_9ALTE|nr:serine/threonine-protein kinase [Saliniradius amylolyticus]AWL13392.1 Non-specific serine/threonine protein kinase [Saliniradius amylolyticus]